MKRVQQGDYDFQISSPNANGSSIVPIFASACAIAATAALATAESAFVLQICSPAELEARPPVERFSRSLPMGPVPTRIDDDGGAT